MLFIIGHLNFPTAGSFIDSTLHRLGNRVCIHDDMAFTVTSSTSNSLDESTFVAKETFLVSIENSYEAHFRNVNSFTEQVNSDQDIKDTQAQVTDNLRPFQGLDIRVHVLNLDTHFLEVVGQVLCHFLGQSCDKGTLIFFNAGIDFTQEVINLSHSRTDFHLWIQESRWTNDLLNHCLGLFIFIVTRCR
ncbi:Uncharacterised protein [Streptococcus pneumoniae]|nr:Uncharacterised protein [Streptococcus pneumoniae]